jgi:hypothetical protein
VKARDEVAGRFKVIRGQSTYCLARLSGISGAKSVIGWVQSMYGSMNRTILIM